MELAYKHVASTRLGVNVAVINDPVVSFPSVHDIPWQLYWNCGLRGVAFDFENTWEVIERGRPKTIGATNLQLLDKISQMGFWIGFGTNSLGDFTPAKQAVEGVTGLADVPFVQPRKRPLRRKAPRKPQAQFFEQFPRLAKLEPTQMIFVGDKLLFDVLPAVEAGFGLAVWVAPLGPDLPLEFYRRWLEKRAASRLNLPPPQRG